jgi:hypothetical protein
MVNLFPEIIPEGGKEPGFLNRAPGLKLLANMGDGPIRGLWQFGGTGERMHFPYTDSTIYDNFCTEPRKTVGNPTPSLTEWRLYNVKSATNNWSSSIDGVTLYSTATNTPVFTGLRHIGLSRNTLGDNLYYLWGYIAEIIIYNRLVDATERSQINTYFSTKYGLTLS